MFPLPDRLIETVFLSFLVQLPFGAFRELVPDYFLIIKKVQMYQSLKSMVFAYNLCHSPVHCKSSLHGS